MFLLFLLCTVVCESVLACIETMSSLIMRNGLRVARRAGRHFSGVTKTSTGLVGLPVDHDFKNTLISIYEDTLKAVEGIPEGAPYRNFVEARTKHNLDIVKEATDAETIEAKIGLGQVEEIADMARRQLAYIPEYVGTCVFGFRFAMQYLALRARSLTHKLYVLIVQRTTLGKLWTSATSALVCRPSMLPCREIE